MVDLIIYALSSVIVTMLVVVAIYFAIIGIVLIFGVIVVVACIPFIAWEQYKSNKKEPH